MLNSNDESRQEAGLGSSFAFFRSSVTRKRVAIGACLLGIIAIGFVPYGMCIGDGGIEMEFQFHSRSAASIQSIAYEFGGHPPIDTEYMDWLRQTDELGALRKYDGKFDDTIRLTVGTSERWYQALLYSYTVSTSYRPKLLLKLTYKNGQREVIQIDLPDPRKTKAMTIEIP